MKQSRGRLALCAGALGGLLITSPVMAQSPTQAPAPIPAPATAQPGGARLVVNGEVTKVDAKRGWIDVKTPEGRMKLHFPASALQDVKVGDSVSIEVAMTGAPGADRK
jgi:hypothetical protein